MCTQGTHTKTYRAWVTIGVIPLWQHAMHTWLPYIVLLITVVYTPTTYTTCLKSSVNTTVLPSAVLALSHPLCLLALARAQACSNGWGSRLWPAICSGLVYLCTLALHTLLPFMLNSTYAAMGRVEDIFFHQNETLKLPWWLNVCEHNLTKWKKQTICDSLYSVIIEKEDVASQKPECGFSEAWEGLRIRITISRKVIKKFRKNI